MSNSVSVRLTRDELWQVVNAISQAYAEDEPNLVSASDKLNAAWVRARKRAIEQEQS